MKKRKNSDCRGVYQLEERKTADINNQTAALCTSEFSELLPLTGGNVVFSTPEGRPTDPRFIRSPAFQEWVTATDIRIVLRRMNTFGDEIFGTPTVLSSYFYAISDIAIGARCKCNGHASECMFVERDGELKKVCNCTHNTKGDDCEMCDDFHQDVPWTPWTWSNSFEIEASECKPCNCNGFSNRCVFDKTLYEKTGHGGHCIDCSHNRDGPNCERCKDNYYQDKETLSCQSCNCDETGSRSLQCNSEGKCDCKPGVTGDKCDHCAADYYDFGAAGCKECNCHPAGSLGNEPHCDQVHGNCLCKTNVEGKECRRCKPGFFSLDKDNEFGCTPCFCYGHSSVCNHASGYSRVVIENTFARNAERWAAQTKFQKPVNVQYDSITQVISVAATDKEPVYFLAPERFLGDQRAAYNQELEFKLRVNDRGATPSINDVILEGNGIQIYQTIFGQGNQMPGTNTIIYKFRLHEDPDFGWEPKKKSLEFMSILSNLTAIKIRGTYSKNGMGFLDDVKLGTARRGAAGQPAGWIEICTCPKGYIGQYCESCAAGYRHDPPNGGPFSVCVPCNCNNHADHCDPESGRCLCLNNTAGDMCERCERGYYGNALAGTPHDCQVCPCPNQGPCYQYDINTVICLECPKGYAGERCDQCSDGYYGDVDGNSGSIKLCKPCDCNMNVDQNAVGICDSGTGECLKCIYNTDGPHCDQCLPGFYGDALALPKEWDICKPCMCDPIGTEQSGTGPLLCNQITGQCQCKPNVTGIKCNQCQPGYFNIESGRGCQPCDCHPIGSYNNTCDVQSGQCHCKPGVTGRLCDHCQDNHFGFGGVGVEGCLPCNCDEIGSKHLQCDQNGNCECSENVEGRRCDRCKENKYDRQRNCVDCPVCYNLVQESVDQHRANLGKLENLLKNIKENPGIVNNEESFERDLKEVQENVEKLWNDAKTYSGDDSKLKDRIDETEKKLKALEETLSNVDQEIDETDDLVQAAERNTTDIKEKIEHAVDEIQNTMDYILTEGVTALAKARNRSIEFGTQNQQMSDIAYQARTTVQKQLDDAEATKAVAEMALNISNQGYLLSQEATKKQLNSSLALDSLNSELANTRLRMDEMEKLVQSTLNDVSAAHSDALSFAIEVNNLIIPEVDFARLKSEAQKAEEEGKRLEEEANRLNDEFSNVAGDVDSKVNQSLAMLEEGKKLQQEADELLAEADAAKAKAAAAVELGDKILRDANETLSSLQDFDQQVKESKAKALTALLTVPDIQTLLQEARDKTTNAEEALAGAENNAIYASTTAQSAQKQYAQQASSEATAIRQKAEETKKDASLLRDEVGNLEEKLLINKDKLSKVVSKADENNQFIEKAKEKVRQAQTKSEEAAEQISKAMESLHSITRELNDLADIDEESLKQLEAKLNQAENDFNEANLDEQLRVLTNARLQQQQRLRSYEEELERLVDEVDRIRVIKESLPAGCFKRPSLEV
nr:laminin subunit gamma-1 isoform X1 [Halyomorpha halys]